MTAQPTRKPAPCAIPASEIFRARAETRAVLFAACEFDLHEAIDVLQADAMATGLVAQIGQDTVQQIMSDAFARVRA
jgi:hypothetical protein